MSVENSQFVWTVLDTRSSQVHSTVTGQIIGTVFLRDSTSPVHYSAYYLDSLLGEYVSEQFAKKAVEEAHRRITYESKGTC